MIKDIMVFPVKEQKGEKHPTHNIIHVEGEGDSAEYIYVGSCWKKKAKNGKVYLSCKMSSEYKDKPGYSIVEDKKAEPVVEEGEVYPDDIPF